MAVTDTRVQVRRGWSLPARMTQAEADLDTQEANSTKLEEKIDRLTAVLFSLLVALSTTAVLLAANLARH